MPLFNTIAIRTSLLFTFVAAGVFLVMAWMIQSAVNRHFNEQDLHALQGKIELISHILTTNNYTLQQQQLNNALVGHHDLVLRIDNQQGQIFFVAGHSTIPNNIINATKIPNAKLQTWSSAGLQYRGFVVTLTTTQRQHYVIAIGTETTHHQTFLRNFERQLGIAGATGLFLLALLSWLAARHGLQPIKDMTLVAESISAQQLHQRLKLNTLPLELQPLAHAFNAMLARLEDSVTRLSDFSSDLAHELRTPINNLLTQTQVSLAKTRSVSAYQDVLYSNLEEYERMARMIADMLFLAKADNGLMLTQQQNINLASECEALFEFYDALAAEKDLHLSQQGTGFICGDAAMIRRALSNLLANAIRHTPAQGSINIVIEQNTTQCKLHIDNTGTPIPAEHLPRLFDRFYRGDASRQRTDEGAGLGLAITKSIINAHQGQISVTSNAYKTRFSLVFLN